MSSAPVRDDITVYWGVAAGGTHAAFRRHYDGLEFFQDAPTPTHCEISWKTVNNQIWEGPTWMIDSGGNPGTIINNAGHPDPISDYIAYLEDPPIKYGDDPAAVDMDHFALRDWPTEPVVREALDLTVEQLQHRTLVDHINTMNRYEDATIDAEPMAVIQGWRVQDYLEQIDRYRDHGLITDKIAIGTLCGRNDTNLIRNFGWRIARNLPARCSIHGFGVKTPALTEPDALEIWDSIDTGAWNFPLKKATQDGNEIGPPGGAYSDWVDWSDRGNPRSTAENQWVSYRGYANNLSTLDKVETPHNTKTVSLDRLFREMQEERPEGQRADEYIIAECLCGKILDPGRPEPIIGGEAGCRHCDREALDIEIRRIQLEDELRLGGGPGSRGRPDREEPPESEQMGLEGFKQDIRDRTEGL